MDDEYKEYRRNKPQQKFYKPGSGPLKRSCYGFESKMNSHDDMGRRDVHQNLYGSQTSVSEVSDGNKDHAAMRPKKPEQQLYVAKPNDCIPHTDRQSKGSMRSDSSSQYNNRRMSNNPDKAYNSSAYSRGAMRRDRHYGDTRNKEGSGNDVNYNRKYRQPSETRSISPTHCAKQQNSLDRNRDSRSMETSAGRHMPGSGAKPPSGRRNSAGYMSDTSRPRHMVNIDNIPPRFRKKYLEQSGYYSSESVDQLHRDKHMSNPSIPPMSSQDQYNPGQNWSQTLPSRGRGRLRDTESFDREKFMNTYLRNYDNSRRSTPSSSYMNLYDPNSIENSQAFEKPDPMVSSMESQKEISESASLNGISMKTNTASSNQLGSPQKESDNDHDSETTSQISSTLLDVTNLDWIEEVEKNIKLDDMCDSAIPFSKNTKPTPEEPKPVENRESKRSGRGKRKDRRSSSRSLKHAEKKSDRNRKDSTASIQPENDRSRKDSNVSIPHEPISASMKNRERRDSHRSNRSSTIGNSRDDLDRWRSLRSYSREQSTEGRIISQCNSRDVSANRATSPRDSNGFRIPNAVTKSTAWLNSNQKKGNGSWANGRTGSMERGRLSPTPTVSSQVVEPAGGGGGSRRSGKRSGRRRSRATEPAHAPAPPPPASHHPPAALHPTASHHPPASHHPLASHHPPTSHHPPASSSSTPMNWREEILESKKQMHDKPQESHQRNRLNSAMSDKSTTEPSNHHPGIIVLPQGSMPHTQKDVGRGGSIETQKHLYDPQNPSKPIIVQTSPSKVDIRMEKVKESNRGSTGYEASDAARAAKHRSLLQEVDRADVILQTHSIRGPLALAEHWNDVVKTRQFLQSALEKLLLSDLKYCQADNMEHYFWKILYYNFIEVLRKSLPQLSPTEKPKVVNLIKTIIEEGNVFLENLVQLLEKTYKFNVDEYINDNHVLPPKGLRYVGLALISVQKLYIFLGDLARYKEQVNDTNNYAKSKFWYTKAQQINPKNGRPYNQLAILAVYSRRKLDAVYYYMRSLMSSNPFHSARESLLTLFEENRRKYEIAERKRRAAIESKALEKRAGAGTEGEGGAPGTRGEVWVRPAPPASTHTHHIEKEQLSSMSSVELNKNFLISYLHVHGKLVTKIGMETFHECASQMLRQFRALLHRQPLPTPAARLLQLTALNMFGVELTPPQHKDGTRSAWLDCALGVSLLMFGVLLERCCALLPAPAHSQQHTDALLLLPAIKVWSDWMLCHSSVWNPPPSFENFDIDSENDPWDWLAKLMNILEALGNKTVVLENEQKEGHVCVRLSEDSALGGFTPLMYMEASTAWARADPALPHHAAEHALRVNKLLFFGTEYLVGVEPPVLRLEYPAGAPPRYVSAVQRPHRPHPPLHHLTEDLEDDEGSSEQRSGAASLADVETGAECADEATKKLLRRKEQLETRQATLEKQRQRMEEILRSGPGSVEIEVRPRWLVPDTNCFIDHLPLLQAVSAAPALPYVLAVPLVVMSELEGLTRCVRVGASASAALAWVAGAGSGVRLVTSRGSLLASRAFTAERDPRGTTNDDTVLATALNLHQNLVPQQESRSDESAEAALAAGARRVREVVLLTDDRNLRVKALAAELPTRDLPSFVHWAGLTRDDATTKQAEASTDTASARQ